MIDLLLLIFITSLVSNGVHSITQKGKIGYFVRAWYDFKMAALELDRTQREVKEKLRYKQANIEAGGQQKSIQELTLHEIKLSTINDVHNNKVGLINFIFDPILICPTCMSSVYGSSIFWGWVIHTNNVEMLNTSGVVFFGCWGVVVFGSACLNAIVSRWAR